jgi:tetratricopeptide (TPR) repeat protein
MNGLADGRGQHLRQFVNALARRQLNQAVFIVFYVVHGLLTLRRMSAIPLQSRPTGRYSDDGPAMRLCVAVCLSLLLLAASVAPARADARTAAKAEAQFGIDVAQRGLWREAIYRWERAIELDPTYAAAFNNLAVAYEHEGQLDKARQAYEKAIALEPQNIQIRQNYDLFKEINDRAVEDKDKP